MRWILPLTAALSITLSFGCDERRQRDEDIGATTRRSSATETKTTDAQTAASQASSSKTTERHVERPVVLLRLAESAYGPTLSFDGPDVLLLTSTAVRRLAPGRPVEQRSVALGHPRALTTSSIVFWSEGALRALPLRGDAQSTATRLCDAPVEPQFLAATGERIAWVERSAAGTFLVRTFDGTRARTLWTSTGSIVGLTLIGDRAYFTEVLDGSWRIGSISLDGGNAASHGATPGRAPSMLASADELFFYDGPRRRVRRLSPDFGTDEVLREGLVCSPLAVSSRVLCGQVGGLFEIPLDAPALLPLSTEAHGSITTIAANDSHVAWLNDSGENRLTVRVLPLPASPR